MVWQDIAVALANVLFIYSLSYQVYQGFKEKKGFITLQTTSLTTLGLYMIVISYFALHLYLSTMVGLVTATLWLMLTIQRIIYKKA
jgi:hypothetical protein